MLGRVGLSLALALVGCGGGDEGKAEAEARVARVRIAEVVEVVPEVSSRHLVLLEAWRRAQLSPRYGGQVAELLVEEQAEVAAGEVLVRLVDADARGSLMSANASRQSSQKRLADLERQLADARELFDSGAGTRREVERLETEVETTRASIRQASGQIIQSRDRKSANEITAPFAGVVTVLDAELGEYASPGAPLVTLSELERLAVEVPLSQLEMVIHARGKLEFEVLIRGVREDAELEWIAREADEGTNTFPARLRIDNRSQRLRAGEAVEVLVRGDEGEPEIVVPPTAIRWEAGQAYVLRATRVGGGDEAEEGREQLERVDVTVHQDVGGGVAVEGPLVPGARVVSSGPATLVDGDEAIMIPHAPRAPGS
ncbi:multidrug efflux system subunit MdtA [Enhygromyxa salina]|uniref:Multidrug efflux system subunit MdtA n=1 Tax=Enhygromyxa salina TaxID=215803 RepID=A0A2S9YEB1_9BACT|nr:efflux RND transporter periplasmic adaptor subunit [Enhygromyxa salina]PRQ03457.1 multidrug efflux system subunit MdtA [Enhygromyxa salina]